eukprot:GDKI01044932.1.p2 GENE.GDKI01044932.1~~GDKI01044932.1.p2  ORF type:complete len:118 (-),score=33.22 GDKI01044932.1:269-577(-)
MLSVQQRYMKDKMMAKKMHTHDSGWCTQTQKTHSGTHAHVGVKNICEKHAPISNAKTNKNTKNTRRCTHTMHTHMKFCFLRPPTTLASVHVGFTHGTLGTPL